MAPRKTSAARHGVMCPPVSSPVPPDDGDPLNELDREILTLLARRRGQAQGDEAAMPGQARARSRQAAKLGLPASLVEPLFRQLTQGTPATPAPAHRSEARSVAVIGGLGGMGARMAGLFTAGGHRVLISDLRTPLRPEQAAREADVVVVSVPILETLRVIQEVGPHVRAEALLMDVTSLKQFPLEAMLASTSASVVGTHPMFGPSVHSLHGQRVVICSGRGAKWEQWLRTELSGAGLVLKDSSAQHHDRAMSVVQVLNHFRTQVVGLALSRLGVSVQDSLEFTSPIYRMELWMTGRHFAQSADLYGPIEMLNPRSREVMEAFQGAARELSSALERRDLPAFSQLFADVRAYFGDFTRVAQERSSDLIDLIAAQSADLVAAQGADPESR